MKQLLAYLVIIAVLAGCAESVDDLQDRDYYPLKVGSYWVYDVNKINYITVSNQEEFHYQLKVEIVDSFVNSENEEVFVLYRSTRDIETDPWEFKETWSATANEIRLVEREGNTGFVKLVFPLYKFRTWDSNVLNSIGEDEFSVSAKGITYDSGDGMVHKNCVLITQEDIFTEILQDTRKEVYSSKVGLVYKERIVIDFDISSEDVIGLYIPASGVSYVQRLINYEQE